MSTAADLTADPDRVDDLVVSDICGYLAGPVPSSFFLFAGAGSGKTRTLIEVLRRLTGLLKESAGCTELADRLRTERRRIGVITYTNNAVDEIVSRLGSNPLVAVSTIHAFCWELIRGFDDDIRAMLLGNIDQEISDAQRKRDAAKGKSIGAAERKLEQLRDRKVERSSVRRFTYSPDTNRFGPEALNHSEVIDIASRLLSGNPTLAAILADRHPILLIDESQDTQKRIVSALMDIEARLAGRLVLGLIGDYRQRVYLDGERDLAHSVPDRWKRPRLRMNHRSQRRIVDLINAIWAADVSGRTEQAGDDAQRARSSRSGGTVRLFVGRRSEADRRAGEQWCANEMARATGDALWNDHSSGYQSLLLEHKMAARRGGFLSLYEALSRHPRYRDGLKDGSISMLGVFERALIPVYEARYAAGGVDEHVTMELLRRHSSLLDPSSFAALSPEEQVTRLKDAQKAMDNLVGLWAGGADPTLGELVRHIRKTSLFDLHEHLRAWEDSSRQESDEVDVDTQTQAVAAAMLVPSSEVRAYFRYVRNTSSFGTQQGVKGSQFPRTLVVLADEEAGGNLFSYDRLFGAQELSDTDRKNAREGKENAIDRTLRLLYVACSRAQESLAVVWWTEDPDSTINRVRGDWFERSEVVRIPG